MNRVRFAVALCGALVLQPLLLFGQADTRPRARPRASADPSEGCQVEDMKTFPDAFDAGDRVRGFILEVTCKGNDRTDFEVSFRSENGASEVVAIRRGVSVGNRESRAFGPARVIEPGTFRNAVTIENAGFPMRAGCYKVKLSNAAERAREFVRCTECAKLTLQKIRSRDHRD